MNLRQACVFSICSVLVGSSLAQAENWPNWRGPKNDGISTETGLATTWDPEKNVA